MFESKHFKMKNQILSLLFVGFVFFSCKVQNTQNIATIPDTFKEAVDYSLANNWAVLPGNYPENIKTYSVQNPQDSIDVFYVYPTLIVSEKDKRWNVTLEDTIQKKSFEYCRSFSGISLGKFWQFVCSLL